MVEIFSYPFMQRALIGGILIGFAASYYGVFVVQRGMSFLGSGLAHAAFGGITLGLLLETEPLFITIPFVIIVALGIAFVKDRSQLSSDTAIGIFFALSMALGIIFLALREGYSADAMTWLFGSILAIRDTDIYAAAVLVLITLLLSPFWKRWSYATFDRELAITDQVPVRKDDYLLSVLIAITIVISIKMVGIVLIAAFLVIPPATARLVSNTFSGMTLTAIILGIITGIAGLVVSYWFDLPSGATIILVQASLFLFVFAIGKRH